MLIPFPEIELSLSSAFAAMAAEAVSEEKPKPWIEDASATTHLLSSYLGLSFAVLLGFLPKQSISYISSLQSRNRILSLKLFQAEDQLKQMRSRRKEDSKANARVVEIFASHRNAWQQEEKRLLHQIDASDEEIAGLKARIDEMEKSEAEMRSCVEKLQREVSEREEMLDFMSRKTEEEGAYGGKVRSEYGRDPEDNGGFGEFGNVRSDYRRNFENSSGFVEVGKVREEFCRNEEENSGFEEYCGDFSGFEKEGLDPVPEVCFLERNSDFDEMVDLYGQQNGFGRDFLPPVAPKAWKERSSGWKDMQYESLESMYHMKHFIARRESPWKVDGESSGVSSKLKLLEQELINLERVGKGDLSKVPSLMRKQAKRYQSLAEKIDDLCRRMQISDPCEPTLGHEFRTQRQTEFLLEAFRLQQRATETRQKLTALQAETTKSHLGDEVPGQAQLSTRRSLDSIRNNFKEIQRNLEIWLARIMGDLEGILARDGASHVRDYYISRYPFVR